jgi:hypothetical protein
MIGTSNRKKWKVRKFALQWITNQTLGLQSIVDYDLLQVIFNMEGAWYSPNIMESLIYVLSSVWNLYLTLPPTPLHLIISAHPVDTLQPRNYMSYVYVEESIKW